MGRVKIAGYSKGGFPGKLKGQDLEILFIDQEGKPHKLPAISFTLTCDGRKENVEAVVVLKVAEMDLDLMATFVREDVGID